MTKRRWVWLHPAVIRMVHSEQLVEHGGQSGIRDEGLLESALARPQNLALYGEPDTPQFSAAYAFGIAKNHPFLDGNKRVAFVALCTFLELNGKQLTAADTDCVHIIEGVASGGVDQEALASWVRVHSMPL
jgi:death on curing protein